MDTPNKVAIHDRSHKITQKTDVLCNKHNVSNLIFKVSILVTTILSRFVALVCSVKQNVFLLVVNLRVLHNSHWDL